MNQAGVGKVYEDGQVVFRQGDPGDCLFVVQDGRVELLDQTGGRETLLRVAGTGEIFGEEVLERERRSVTVRVTGRTRILTITKKNLLTRINEDPSLAFHLVETLCRRVRELRAEVVQLRRQLAAADHPSTVR